MFDAVVLCQARTWSRARSNVASIEGHFVKGPCQLAQWGLGPCQGRVCHLCEDYYSSVHQRLAADYVEALF